MDDKLVVYTHPECSYSDALKEELSSSGAELVAVVDAVLTATRVPGGSVVGAWSVSSAVTLL